MQYESNNPPPILDVNVNDFNTLCGVEQPKALHVFETIILLSLTYCFINNAYLRIESFCKQDRDIFGTRFPPSGQQLSCKV